MIQRAEDMGLAWNGRGPAPVDVLLNTIAEPVVALLPDFIEELQRRLGDWVQTFLPYHANCIAPAEATTSLTRFNHLVRVTSQPLPTEAGEQLSWVWKALLGIATASVWSNRHARFPKGRPSQRQRLASGMTSKRGQPGCQKTKRTLSTRPEKHTCLACARC